MKLSFLGGADEIGASITLIPASWGLSKTPSLHLTAETVSLQLSHPPDAEELARAGSELEQRTGFRLP